jgi:hypothetical protein
VLIEIESAATSRKTRSYGPFEVEKRAPTTRKTRSYDPRESELSYWNNARKPEITVPFREDFRRRNKKKYAATRTKDSLRLWERGRDMSPTVSLLCCSLRSLAPGAQRSLRSLKRACVTLIVGDVERHSKWRAGEYIHPIDRVHCPAAAKLLDTSMIN